MRAGTHYFFALLALQAADSSNTTMNIFCASAALLPDIDHKEATISKVLGLGVVAKIINKHFEHRTLTHSLLGVFIVMFLSSPLLYFGHSDIWIRLNGAYFSHIFIDMLNVSGVYLFYPLKNRFGNYHEVGSGKINIRVGSATENLLLLLFAAASITLVSLNFTLQDVTKVFSKTLYQTYDMAHRDYQEFGRYVSLGKIKYYDNKRKELTNTESLVLYMKDDELMILKDKQIIKKTDIDTQGKIELIKLNQKVDVSEDLKGDDLSFLKQYKDKEKVFVSGEIKLKNVREIKEIPIFEMENIIKIKHTNNTVVLELNYANLNDLAPIINIKNELKLEINELLEGLPETQIYKLRQELINLKNEYNSLDRVKNYERMRNLEDEIKGKESKILSLRNTELLNNEKKRKLEKLQKAEIEYWLNVYNYSGIIIKK